MPKENTISPRRKTKKDLKEEKFTLEYDIQRLIELLIDIQKIKEQRVNDLIKNNTLEQIKIQPYDPLKILLEHYGNPDDLIEEFTGKNEIKLEAPPKKTIEEKVASFQKRSNTQLLPDKELQIVKKSYSETNKMQLVLYKPPSLDLNLKATQDIQKIKQNKEEKEAKVIYLF